MDTLVAHKDTTNVTQHSIHGHIFALDERGVLVPQPTGALREAILKHGHYRAIAAVQPPAPPAPVALRLERTGTPVEEAFLQAAEQVAATLEAPAAEPTEAELSDEELVALVGEDEPPADLEQWTQKDLVEKVITLGYERKVAWTLSKANLIKIIRAQQIAPPPVDDTNIPL